MSFLTEPLRVLCAEAAAREVRQEKHLAFWRARSGGPGTVTEALELLLWRCIVTLRKSLAFFTLCFAAVVAIALLPRQAAAGERARRVRSVGYLADQSGQPRIVPQPVPWRTWNGGYYYAPPTSVRGYRAAPTSMFYYGPYAGGWAGVSPPVTHPPHPGAYWAYGYSQYPFGAYYGW